MTLFLSLVGMPEEAINGMRNAPVWPALEAVAPTLAYDAAVLRDGAVPVDLAAKVTVPTLVLAGGASPDWMAEATRRTAEAIPCGRHAILPGQEHTVDDHALAPVLA